MKPMDKKYQLELIHMMKRETNGLLMDFRVELLVYNNKINNLSYFLYRYNVYSLNECSSIRLREYSKDTQ